MSSEIYTILVIFSFLMLLRMFSPEKHKDSLLISLSLVLLLFLAKIWILLFLFLALMVYLVKKKFNEHRYKFLVIIIIFSSWGFFKIGNSIPHLSHGFILPLGFSIFLLQQVSVLVKAKSNITFKKFLLYSFSFGNLFIGPVWEYSDFDNEYEKKTAVDDLQLHKGVLIILFAFARLAIVVNAMSSLTLFLKNDETVFNGNLLIPFLLNKYEIYLNFLSYTQMAIGMLLLFGYNLKENFNRPFYTTSIIEFWQRWNINFINWIRSYIFYPLLISPFGKLGGHFLILVIFIFFGLWHNLTWNHFAYGVIQFILITSEGIIKRHFDFKIKKNVFVKISLWLFFYVVLLSIPGLIFSLNDFAQVKNVLSNIINKPIGSSFSILRHTSNNMFVFIGSVIFFEYCTNKFNFEKLARLFTKFSFIKKVILFILFCLLVIVLGEWDKGMTFVYSRF